LNNKLNIVTGAFGYTGRYITQRLLSMGEKVRTITGHPDRPNPFSGQVDAFPFNFDNPTKLAESMEGATTLYNTYWIRFPHGDTTFDRAVENTKTLIKAAEEAGIRRIVHISITNPSEDSPFPYFKGKAIIEKAIINSKLSYAIIRPTVMFGHKGILINNIAWILRNLPVFIIPGSGDYQLQPVFVEDVAEIAVNTAHKNDNIIIDAAGPEIYTFKELVKLIAEKTNSKTKIIHLKPEIALLLSKIVGYIIRDVLITKDEISGLMSNLLVSEKPPTGKTRLSHWLEKNKDTLGKKYASELERHYR